VIVTDIVFGVDGLQAFVLIEPHSPVHVVNAILHADVEVIFAGRRYFHDDRQGSLGFIDIGRRYEGARGRGRFLLFLDFALLLDLQLLR
jgi:hypothetical protein